MVCEKITERPAVTKSVLERLRYNLGGSAERTKWNKEVMYGNVAQMFSWDRGVFPFADEIPIFLCALCTFFVFIFFLRFNDSKYNNFVKYLKIF